MVDSVDVWTGRPVFKLWERAAMVEAALSCPLCLEVGAVHGSAGARVLRRVCSGCGQHWALRLSRLQALRYVLHGRVSPVVHRVLTASVAESDDGIVMVSSGLFFSAYAKPRGAGSGVKGSA